jgi:Tfp pilus assembly protein PilE
MNFIKNKKGITLISLVITIIILLILAGVTLFIVNNSLMKNVTTAVNATAESTLEEKIKLAWMNIEISYWDDIKSDSNINKIEYFKEQLEKILADTEDITETSVTICDNNISVVLLYQNVKYAFSITQDGKVTKSKMLKGNVKVGDYVEYPIEYIDEYSEQNYTATTGWRVIDDGTMDGTSGIVKIVSSGIPAKWYYDCSKYATNQLAVNDLINNFEELELRSDLKGTKLKGSEFKLESISNKITALSLNDLNLAYNELYKTNIKLNDKSILDDKSELFYPKTQTVIFYWLATPDEDINNKIYCMSFRIK